MSDLKQSTSGTIHELRFQLDLEKSQVKEMVTKTASLYGELAGKDSKLLKMETENERLGEIATLHEGLMERQRTNGETMNKARLTIQSLQEVRQELVGVATPYLLWEESIGSISRSGSVV